MGNIKGSISLGPPWKIILYGVLVCTMWSNIVGYGLMSVWINYEQVKASLHMSLCDWVCL